MNRNRLEAFSDGVIAIIITIMVLELKAPHEPTLEAFAKLTPIFLSYALSFLIVAIYWVNHHHLLHLIRRVDGGLLWANINLLFWLSLMPFATSYLGDHHAAPMAAAFYGLINSLCAFSFSFLRQSIACHQKDDPLVTSLHQKLARKNLLAIAIYAASIPCAFLSPKLALALIALPAAMYFRPDAAIEQINEALEERRAVPGKSRHD